MKKIKWNIISSALSFQLLLEKDQSWKNKSKLSNVLSLEISLRSHELDSASCTVSILFFLRLLQTTWPSQKTDQIYVGKAKHTRCNLRTQQKRLTHVLKWVEYGCYYCVLLENTSKIAVCCWKFAAATNEFQDSNVLGCINASELSVQCIVQSVFFGLLGTFGAPHFSSMPSLLIIHV